MDFTSILGAILGGSKSRNTASTSSTGGLDVASIIKIIAAMQQSKSSTQANANGSGIDIASIIKILAATGGSSVLTSILTGGQQQTSAQTNNNSLNNMSNADIAGMAGNAAEILKGIFGNKG